MPTSCIAPFKAQSIRATRLDACGIPLVGAKSVVVSDGVISVELKGNTESTSDVMVKNAKGAIRVNEPGDVYFSYWDYTVTMTEVDMDLFEMFTGQQLETDASGNAVGMRVSEKAVTGNVALETWTKVGSPSGALCSTTGQYGYFLLPLLVQGMIGDLKLEAGAMDCVISGRTRRGTGWGSGPYNVVPNATGVPSKLTIPMDPLDHLLMRTTTVAPPLPSCGATALAAA